jgi:hypothetical protein
LDDHEEKLAELEHNMNRDDPSPGRRPAGDTPDAGTKRY